MTLYELTGEHANLAANLMECNTDEEIDLVMEAFNQNDMDMTEKAGSYARIIKNFEADADALEAQAKLMEAEAKRIKARASARKNDVKRMKANILFAMDSAGMQQLRSDIGTFFIRQDVSTSVTDASAVPERFLIPQPPKVDITAAKNEFKLSGELFEGLEFKISRTVQFR